MSRFTILQFLIFFILSPGILAEQNLTPQEAALIDLTNIERLKKGLQPLKANTQLMQAARDYSALMTHVGKLTHSLHGKSFASRIKKSGYDYRRVGENVARSKECFPHVMKLWMKSHGHRNNILNPEFDEIGVGIGVTKKGDRYFTQLFGKQR